MTVKRWSVHWLRHGFWRVVGRYDTMREAGAKRDSITCGVVEIREATPGTYPTLTESGDEDE